MPVIDWIRTDLQYLCPDGTSSLYYDRIRFAYFDMKILEREGAEKDYTEEELHKVLEMGSDFIQGFYYSKPLPFNEITDYLKNFKKII